MRLNDGLIVHHSYGREQCWEKGIISDTESKQDPELRKVIKVNVTQI